MRPAGLGPVAAGAAVNPEAGHGALIAFRLSVSLSRDPSIASLAQAAEQATDADAFFADHFEPDASSARVHFTGYYEPVLKASPVRTDRFQWPVCRPPDALRDGTVWHDRAAIETCGMTAGLEIAWLDDPLDAFLLQVQGSGRLCFPNGRTLRLGFAATNGHPYRSIGAELVRRGEIAPERIDLGAIRQWCMTHPDDRCGLLRHNPSYVFFRVIDLPPDCGPLGTMGCPVTPLASLAVDPEHIPLGSVVRVEVPGPVPVSALMVAQDTGSAIKGPARADIFFGAGPEAERLAGAMRAEGTLTLLRPRAGGRP